MSRSNWSRESRHKRGYGNAWDKLRLQVLRRDCGLCQCDQCKAQGRVTLAGEVHHIKGKAEGGTDDMANLQAVSHACHERIEAAKAGRTLKPRVVIGIDGYPLDSRSS